MTVSYKTNYVILNTVGSGTFTVPADWSNNNTIHLIGGGGGGASISSGFQGSGGGGGYTKITNYSASPGSTVSYTVGSGGLLIGGGAATNGGNTVFGAYTAGGGFGANSVNSGASGSGTGGIGSTYNGGNGYAPSGGGGGAAGPYGNGANATQYNGGTGGGGFGGTGGSMNQKGGNGTEIGYGVGSGGGSGFNSDPSNGNLYGGGGGYRSSVGGADGALSGGQGIIVVVYQSSIPSYSGTNFEFFIQNYDGTSSNTKVDMADMFVGKDSWYNAGLWGWGRGYAGAIGNGVGDYGISTLYSSPIQIGSLTNWKQISAGDSSALAIKTDGTMWAWGYNNVGQLGNGTTTDYSSPIQIGSLSSWKQVSISSSAAAIKTDGTLWTWGQNTNGGLGNGTTTDYSSPIQIGTSTNWKQVSAINTYYKAAVKTDGTLWTWGRNVVGQLGYEIPVFGTTNTTTINQVAGGATWANTDPDTTILYEGSISYTTFAIDKNGGLWGWGINNFGQLGNETRVYYSSPIQIGSLTNWKQVSSGFWTNNSGNSAAIKTDGTLWTWGGNAYGQLGNGTVTSYSSPIQIGSLTNWKQVVCGSNSGGYNIAVKTNGTLWAWGYNYYGQLGNNSSNESYSSPIQIGSLTNWKQVACGYAFTVATKTDGTLWAWGLNNNGQLGNGTTTSSVTPYSSPIQIGLLTNWKQVAAGNQQALAVKTDGTLWAWGTYPGNGTTSFYSSPIQVGSLTNWKQVSGGYNASMAVKTDGTLWAWGQDGYGNNSLSPVQIGTSTNWTQVNCNYSTKFAYASDNKLYAYGRNQYGQLGVPSSLLGNSSSPIQIGSLTNWKQVACGYGGSSWTAAIKSDGTLWTWGSSNYGQLGNGATLNYSSPIQIGSLTNWKQVACGYFSTASIKTDGTLWTWGRNNFGQLGNGATLNYSSPIQIGALTNWKQVSDAGSVGIHAAVKTDGTLWTWGQNVYGWVGDGTTVNKSSPVQIGSRTIWKTTCAGGSAVFAIQAPELELAKYVPGAPTGLSI